MRKKYKLKKDYTNLGFTLKKGAVFIDRGGMYIEHGDPRAGILVSFYCDDPSFEEYFELIK